MFVWARGWPCCTKLTWVTCGAGHHLRLPCNQAPSSCEVCRVNARASWRVPPAHCRPSGLLMKGYTCCMCATGSKRATSNGNSPSLFLTHPSLICNLVKLWQSTPLDGQFHACWHSQLTAHHGAPADAPHAGSFSVGGGQGPHLAGAAAASGTQPLWRAPMPAQYVWAGAVRAAGRAHHQLSATAPIAPGVQRPGSGAAQGVHDQS